ncbi:MAG: hypothetical protein ACK40L_18275 [Hydrogenophaga sp.]
MAKRKRIAPPATDTRAPASRPDGSAMSPLVSTEKLPGEALRGDWTLAILALMMFLAPALGVPNEELLQDTLKSIVVSFAALAAALCFFWHQRNRGQALRWRVVALDLEGRAVGASAWRTLMLR